jgi:hypothetical protein
MGRIEFDFSAEHGDVCIFKLEGTHHSGKRDTIKI